MWSVARRPKWIGVLILTLAVAAIFAALGQWQLARSFEREVPVEQQTERAMPLTEIAEPQQTPTVSGQIVSTEVEFTPDATVLSGRLNHGDLGFWVVGHGITDGGTSLAVALGWAADEAAADAAASALQQSPPDGALVGRFLPSEQPIESDFKEGERSALAVPELINLWETVPDGVYSGYMISSEPASGLEAIDAPAPSQEVSLNLLNLLYAIEWVIFGLFAVYLWYRLVKDAWEEEQLAAEEAAAAPDVSAAKVD